MNRRIVIIISVIAILLLGWVVMVHIPASRDLKQLNQQLAALEEKERQRVPEHRIQAIRTQVDSLSVNVDERMERFYPEEQLLDLGRTIESVGKQYSLRLVSITPDYESLPLFVENNKEISELPLSIEFKGHFEQLTQFLDAIPEFPFVMRFREMVYEKENSSKKELYITLKGVIALKRMKTPESEPEDDPGNDPANKMASIGIANQT